jgi:hypothetical protein
MIVSGRRNGRMAAQRQFIRHVLLTEGHLHVAATDGLWCVSATGIGPLWRKLRQSCPDKRPYRASGALYDQMRRNVIYDEIPRREWTADPT